MSGDTDFYTFEMMREKVGFLRLALQRAISADKAEAAAFWTDVKRVGKYGVLFAGREEKRFNAEGAVLVARANDAMMRIEAKCDGKLRDNAPIPQRLLDDARQWERRAARVREMIGQCQGQRDILDWTGEAKNRYVETVMVQESALQELRGVMESTAKSCKAGAVLNQAIFMAVGNAAYEARERVEESLSAGWSSYFLRTANAIPVLEALEEQVDRAVSGEVADGSAINLSGEAESTVSALPNLLVEGQWPTGTAAAGVSPADTAGGVTSDGSDADTDVEANIRSCLAGARL